MLPPWVRRTTDQSMILKVVKLRQQGLFYHQIGERLGLGANRIREIYLQYERFIDHQKKAKQLGITDELYLSSRATSALGWALTEKGVEVPCGWTFIISAAKVTKHLTPNDLRISPNCGKVTLREIIHAMKEYGWTKEENTHARQK